MNSLMPLLAIAITSITSTPASGDGEAASFETSTPRIDLLDHARVEFTFAPGAIGTAIDANNTRRNHADAEYDGLALAAIGRHDPFGMTGSMRLNFHGAFGNDIKTSDNQFGLIGGGISYFIIENVSLDLELNGLYISQRGSDAWAGNVNLLFRWHFFSQETWSIYLDGGAGIFFASKRVPQDGTHFNFTPQLGAGVSFEIAPDLRLLSGIRWHHISNASTSSNNPGRDSVMGYVGVSLPF